MKHVDVLIIGGSLAGSACARELTRRGVDAVAFERDRFPREKVCGGFLSPGALDLLDELRVLDSIHAAGAVPVRHSRVRMRQREVVVELPRPGLGISRKTLDSVVANHAAVRQGTVRGVRREGNAFHVQLDDGEVSARVVIDAAGKLSRFTPRRTAPQFGVQFYETESRADVLEFWFLEDGYGGKVSVEGGRSNACILINKDARALRDLVKPNTLVTGPLSYDGLPGNYIAIGDARGMVDPFCGEGMRHALDTGIRAATHVAHGLAHGLRYEQMRAHFEADAAQRWNRKRMLGRFVRSALNYPRLLSAGFHFKPEFWFRKLWA